MNKLDLIFFKTPYDDQIIYELTGELLSHDHYKFTTSYDPKDIIAKIPTMECGVLLFYINDKYDLQEAILILKTLSKFGHGKFFKFFSILTYDYSRSERILKKLGCLGFYTPADKPLRISKKIELLRNKLISHLKPTKKEDLFDLPLDPQILSQSPIKIVDEEPIKFISALDIASDTWIIKSKSDCSFTTSLWKINVWGPSPHLGKWIEVTTVADNLKTWKFVFNDDVDKNCFVESDGNWFFEGERPIYDWGKKFWLFKDANPHLYFINSLDEKFSRFYFENSKFHITKNSDIAIAKEDLINASSEVKINQQQFKKLREDFLGKSVVREFSLESGEISVDLEYEPNLTDFNLKCEFEDFHEKELIVLAPPNSIAYEAKVRAQVLLKYNGQEAGVICHGKILEIEALEKKDSLTIGVQKMNTENFKNFLDLYALRQANINDFMTRAKGF